MCGIVGYTGNENAIPFLLNGIKRLEYRGYDSYGVFLQPEYIHKSTGNIDVESFEKDVYGTTGIAHTRWATSGEVNEINAHPHQYGKITIVHNGVISNYKDIKKKLESSGHHFKSETDSEVLAHLIGVNGVANIPKAFSQIEGEVGSVLVTDDAFTGTIWAYSDGSPLVAGIDKNGGLYIASDVKALAGYTKTCYRLNSMQWVRLGGTDTMEQLIKGQEIEVPESTAEKDGFTHYMMKEINEQSVQSDYDRQEFQLPWLREANIKIVACGSSYYAGLLGKCFLENIAHIPTTVEYASEVQKSPLITPETMHVAISQSGETKDTLSAAKRLTNAGEKLVSFHNSDYSTLTTVCRYNNNINAGPEIGVAATKTFFKTSLSLYQLAEYYKSGKWSLCPQLKRDIAEVIACRSDINEVAQQIGKYNNFLVLGSGYHYPIALEVALKLKEVAYVHAEAMPAAEMKHGPIALVDSNTPSIFFYMDSDPNKEQILQNMDEIKSRKGNILVFTNCQDVEADWIIELPRGTKPELQPLVSVVAGQMLAYCVALIRGCDIDKPRNLAKSVTV
jgi:glucosamine--fructose-6-phosphate aminotransferase (isomerizing)